MPCSTHRVRGGIAWLLLAALVLPSCVWLRDRPRVAALPTGGATSVTTPVKVHLKDGSTVVFAEGASLTAAAITGKGTRYGLALEGAAAVTTVPLAEVAAVETFRTESTLEPGLTLLSTAAAVAVSPVIYAAIFGSCPTVYSGPPGHPHLEAETFSSSIVPLFEARDVDRLSAQPDAAGRLRLDVRNEALETHYINHLELLEVRHPADARVVPDQRGRPAVVSGERASLRVVDRAGRDLAGVLSAADDSVFRTDAGVLKAAGAADMDDWIDVTLPPEAAGETVALVFRMRNSLLNTVLFYDVMLAAAGPRSLDWLGRDLERIDTAVELGRWVRRRFGLRVLVRDGGGVREVARVPDAGPIAWREVAAVFEAPRGEGPVRVRLAFVADAWRLDRVTWAPSVAKAKPRRIALSRVSGPRGEPEPAALPQLRQADDSYLRTTPGQRFLADFETGPPAAGEQRTFLLSSQGYYTEWIRGEWLKPRAEAARFQPGDRSLLSALTRWKESQAWYENTFDKARVSTP